MSLQQRIPFRNNSGSTSSGESPESRTFAHVRLKRRCGALLWSSHWFFLNPKLKRILFISVWAHTKNAHRRLDDDEWFGTTVADFLTNTYPFTTWLASLCLICHTRPTWTNR